MKKLLSLTALCLSLFLLASCTQTETDEPSVSSLPGSSESSQSQSAQDPDSLEIKLTPEILQQNQANLYSCACITQDARSYYYRHPIKGTLYRYDKETGKQKELFNKNLTYSDNGFLHSIKLYEDRIFFVTRTSEDQAPTLYSIDRNGGNLIKHISNVGDDYHLTKDYIYFTTMADPQTGEWFTLYRLERKTGKVIQLLSHQCEFLNFVGDDIYYTDGTFTEETVETGRLVCKYSLKTGERTVLDVQNSYPETLSSFLNLYYLDGSLYFLAAQTDGNFSENGVFRYDLKSGKTEKIITVLELIQNGAPKETQMLYFTVVNANHFWVYGQSNDVDPEIETQYVLAEIKDGKINLIQSSLNTKRRALFQPYFSNEKAVLVSTSCDKDNLKIIGLEELNKTIDDEQAA